MTVCFSLSRTHAHAEHPALILMAPGNVPFLQFNAFYPLADFLPNKSTAVLLSVLLAHTLLPP